MRLFACLMLAAGLLVSAPSHALEIIVDDFDGGADTRVTETTITPETGFPTFLGSIFDVFGPTDRTANFDFADDSVEGNDNPNPFPTDALGIAPYSTYPEGEMFFGVEDLDNPDNNPGTGTGEATWTVDISGLSNLTLLINFSAMGDFEAGDNSHVFEASIDGGTSQLLFSIDANNDADFTYMMESGTEVTLNDPLELIDDLGTRVIDNSFTLQGQAAIDGAGSELVLTYTAGQNNGGEEVFAFDNIILSDEFTPPMDDADLDDDGDVDGDDYLKVQRDQISTTALWQRTYGSGNNVAASVPEPASSALLMIAMTGFAARRRR